MSKLHLILTTYINKLSFFMSEFQHVGDLGNILADKNGRAHFRMEDRNVKVWYILQSFSWPNINFQLKLVLFRELHIKNWILFYQVWDVIGRSLVVHSREDDLGRGSNVLSQINGNSGPG